MVEVLTALERGALAHIHKTRTSGGYKHQMPVRRLLELGLIGEVDGFLALTKLGEDVLRSARQGRMDDDGAG
jgi:hypothetical protein